VKDMKELILPEGPRYAEDHEWAQIDGDVATIGVSDYAQDQLGDITYVELPAVGDIYKKGEEFGTLESTKAVSEVFMPLSGEVVEVNEALGESPGLVNTDPYGEGWLVKVKMDDPSELDSLMTADEYGAMLEGGE
jgi:glycine cleavage system H protein